MRATGTIHVWQADSTEEVIDFSVAAIRKAEPEVRRFVEDRTLIIDTQEAARQMEHVKNMVLLFGADAIPVAGLLAQRNLVIVPIGRDNPTPGNANLLEQQTLSGLTSAIKTMGLPEEEARSLALTCGRSVTILARRAVNAPELRKELAQKQQEAWGLTDCLVENGRQSLPTVRARLAAAEARIAEIEDLLARAKEPEPIVAFTAKDIKEHLLDKLRDLQSVLISSPQIGKQTLPKYIGKIAFTPGEDNGKRVLHVVVEFKLGGGNSGVVLTGSVDASMQQYGFSTITVRGLTLDTSRVRRKPEAPTQETDNGGSTPISLTPAAEASDPTQGSDSGRKEIHA